jgi:cyclophilin family peptidyl-prolyl cis-trans isomerase
MTKPTLAGLLALTLLVSCETPDKTLTAERKDTDPVQLESATAPSPTPETITAPTPMSQNTAVLTTKFGKIVIALDETAAPKTVANFKKLAAEGFYNGTTFHRCIPGFMIQGGDPNSKSADKSTHGMGGPGYTVPAEIGLKHKRGAVATARLGDAGNPRKESSGSQFFICVADCGFLDGEYTVFGNVIEGMEVADQIVKQPRDRNDNPNERVEMQVALGTP